MANDDIVDIHLKLLTDISDSMVVGNPEHESFIEHMKRFIPKGLLASKGTLLKKMEAMATKGKLGVGNYDHLKKIAEASGNVDILELISKAEQKIKTLQTEAVPQASPSSSRAVQETKHIKQVKNHKTSNKRSKNRSAENDGGPSSSKQLKLEGKNHKTSNKRRKNKSAENDGGPSTSKQLKLQDEEDQLFTKDKDGRQRYNTKGKKGLLLILNSTKNRKATNEDATKLSMFFGDILGFDIHDPRKQTTDDLTTKEIKQCLKGIRDILSKDKTYYCFICVILSHGNWGHIVTKDGEINIEKRKHKYFTNKKIPNFAGRPKLFFIQSCRGSEIQKATYVDEEDDATQSEAEITEDEADINMISIPHKADTLIAHSTTLGNVSYRRVCGGITGSWFITECMSVFEKEWKTHHVEDMLITVRERVALDWINKKEGGGKQMPCVSSTLTTRLYLTKDNTST